MENPASQDEADITLDLQFQFISEGRQQGVNWLFQYQCFHVGHTIIKPRKMLTNYSCFALENQIDWTDSSSTF